MPIKPSPKKRQIINKAFDKAFELGADDFWVSTHKTKALAQDTAKILNDAGFNAEVGFTRGILGVKSGQDFGVFIKDFDLKNAKKICENLGGEFGDLGSCQF